MSCVVSLQTPPPKSFSSGLLSICSLPSLYLYLELPWPRCRTLHLALLNFMRFTQAHLSSLSRSLWMAFLPSSVWTTPHNLVLSADLLRVYSIPLSMSLTKILNTTGPTTNPWGMLLCVVLPTDIGVIEVLHGDRGSPPWGPGLLSMRLLLSVCKGPHPLGLPGWVACSRPPL